MVSIPPVLKPNEATIEITKKEDVNQPINNVGFRKLSINPVQKPPLSFVIFFE
jgi:hypothetical protein